MDRLKPGVPRSGDIVWICERASVQFAGDSAFWFRVIRLPDWPTYYGWVWLEGYVLDKQGDAALRRTIFVQMAGLDPIREPARSAGGNRR